MKNKNSEPDWFVLVNPNAGSGKGRKDWDHISRILDKNGFSFTQHYTKHKYHAVDLVSQTIESGTDRVIVVGGDGTLNEAVNGIFAQKKVLPHEVILGMIPVGTGNDWGRMFQIPSKYEDAISVLKEGKTFKQDVGIIRYSEKEGQKSRHFINIAGLGFDAKVVQKANRQKDQGKGGALLYFLNIFNTLMSYKSTHVSIQIDGNRVLEDRVLTMSLGIGKYSGGGMLQTPNAKPDDGLIDLTVIKEMGKLRVIASLKKLYDGTILKHPRVDGFSGKVIHIKSDPPIYTEVDGESLGLTPAEFEILPGSLQVIVGGI